MKGLLTLESKAEKLAYCDMKISECKQTASHMRFVSDYLKQEAATVDDNVLYWQEQKLSLSE